MVRRVKSLIAIFLVLITFFVFVCFQKSKPENKSSEVNNPQILTKLTDSELIEDRTLVERTPVPLVMSKSGVSNNDQKFSSLNIRVISCTGSPAEGVGLVLIPWNATDPFFDMQRGISGTDGYFFWENVQPGRVRVYTNFGRAIEILVKPNERAEISLVLDKGAEVTGIVTTPHGDPISNAQIWISEYAHPSAGEVACKTNAAGEFKINCVPQDHYIGARLGNYVPSPLRRISKNTSEVRLNFTLSVLGGKIAGSVSDTHGVPVANAQLLIGAEHRQTIKLEDGSLGIGPPPNRLTTDSEGKFSAEGLESGELPLVVRARGFAPLKQKVQIIANETVEKELQLIPGATVEGIIINNDGLPVPNIFVGVGPYGDFGSFQTYTNSEGRFRLEGLNQGTIKIYANGETLGKAVAELNTTAGEVLYWEGKLTRGSVLKGRLVNASNDALENWMIQVIPQNQQFTWRGQARTDLKGYFEIPNFLETPNRLEVRSPEKWDSFPVLVLQNITISDQELIIRVDDIKISSYIEGEIEGPLGKVTEDAQVVISQAESRRSFRTAIDMNTGHFIFGPLPASQYQLTLSSKDFGKKNLGTVKLLANQTLYVGKTVLEPPGHVEIKIVRNDEDKEINSDVILNIFDDQNLLIDQVKVANPTFRYGPLTPGKYSLRKGSLHNFEADRYDFIINSEKTTCCEVIVHQ